MWTENECRVITIKVSNVQKCYNLSDEHTEYLKSVLTFDNPKYTQAKKYGRSKVISIPRYLTYYRQFKEFVKDGVTQKVLEVPVGVKVRKLLYDKFGHHNLSFKYEKDGVVRVHAEYPDFKMSLRDDQNKAFNSFHNYDVYQAACDYSCSGIIQLPTGKGKTILGLYLAQHFKQKTLVLVHRENLMVGWQKDIKECFGDIRVGIIKGRKRVIGEQITISTVQTLSSIKKRGELDSYVDKFGMVIIDECHHIGANTFNIVNDFKASYKVGLSATPTREDGLSHVFDIFFNGIVYRHEYSINDKDILPAEVIIAPTRVQYEPFVLLDRRTGFLQDQVFNFYDFKQNELPDNYVLVSSITGDERPRIPFFSVDDYAVKYRKYKIQVCKDILREARDGHSCLVFFRQKEHIDIYYNYLRRYFSEDKIIKYYGDSKEDSKTLLEKAESREALITLSTYAKATEGTNVKAWEVMFLVSSLNNKRDVIQATGRIRRTAKGKLKKVRIYDYFHSSVYGLKNHLRTRISAYKDLQYEIQDNSYFIPLEDGLKKRGRSMSKGFVSRYK